MKPCNTCLITKPLSEFHVDNRSQDGFRFQCKSCRSIYLKTWSQTETGSESRRKGSQKYWRSAKGQATQRSKQQKHPEKYKARTALNNAIRHGKITKPATCSECGVTPGPRELHGHHHDYSKPLDVTWLCRQCHRIADGLPLAQ